MARETVIQITKPLEGTSLAEELRQEFGGRVAFTFQQPEGDTSGILKVFGDFSKSRIEKVLDNHEGRQTGVWPGEEIEE